MNGLGNEIVIVDMRRAPSRDRADEARAAARQRALRPVDGALPARAGTDAFVRIYNNDGSEAGACGNGMRCVAALVSAETGKAMLRFETAAGLLTCWQADGGLFTVDMGAPRFRWDEIPLAAEMARYARDRFAIGRSTSRSCIRRRLSAWAIRTRSSGSRIEGLRSAQHRAACWRTIRSFRERANITLAATPVARSHRDPHLGARRRSDQGLRLGGLRGSGRGGAARRTDRKVTVTVPGGDLAIDWRESDDHVLMTGPVEYEHEGLFDAALFAAADAAS